MSFPMIYFLSGVNRPEGKLTNNMKRASFVLCVMCQCIKTVMHSKQLVHSTKGFPITRHAHVAGSNIRPLNRWSSPELSKFLSLYLLVGFMVLCYLYSYWILRNWSFLQIGGVVLAVEILMRLHRKSRQRLC